VGIIEGEIWSGNEGLITPSRHPPPTVSHWASPLTCLTLPAAAHCDFQHSTLKWGEIYCLAASPFPPRLDLSPDSR
jgi:hypothetical protein